MHPAGAHPAGRHAPCLLFQSFVDLIPGICNIVCLKRTLKVSDVLLDTLSQKDKCMLVREVAEFVQFAVD